jgi:diaminopimelate decarboxylase
MEVVFLDIGGGWFPDDINMEFLSKMERAIASAKKTHPSLREFFFEPGKALTQGSMALIVKVIEARDLITGSKELVVDGSIAELPQAAMYPHRIVLLRNHGDYQPLGRGKDRILGRLCMENDILAIELDIPYGVLPGNRLAILDSGAYDRSMSYEFGK